MSVGWRHPRNASRLPRRRSRWHRRHSPLPQHLESCTDRQPERLPRLAQNVVGPIELQRLLVAELSCSGGREVTLEGVDVIRSGVRYRQLLSNVLVEAQRVVGIEDAERRIDDRQNHLQLRAVRHAWHLIGPWNDREYLRELDRAAAETGSIHDGGASVRRATDHRIDGRALPPL